MVILYNKQVHRKSHLELNDTVVPILFSIIDEPRKDDSFWFPSISELRRDFNYDSEDQYLNVILKDITTISKISWVEFIDKTKLFPIIKGFN